MPIVWCPFWERTHMHACSQYSTDRTSLWIVNARIKHKNHLFVAPLPQVALEVGLASIQRIFVFNKCKMTALGEALAELLTDHLILRCLSIYQVGFCKQMFDFTTENIPIRLVSWATHSFDSSNRSLSCAVDIVGTRQPTIATEEKVI